MVNGLLRSSGIWSRSLSGGRLSLEQRLSRKESASYSWKKKDFECGRGFQFS
jgi:hypothetical protein